MIRIFVGDVTEYLSEYTQGVDATATLLTDKSPVPESGNFYTSLGDFTNINSFNDILSKADELIYCPPIQWSDTNSNGYSDMKNWTELCLLDHHNKIKNLDSMSLEQSQRMLMLTDTRKTNDKQIWSVGCSITHGVGIDQKEIYSQLIADKLNLPISFLSSPGSSIRWAADQILRSDIRKDDIVLWGLTDHARFPYWSNSELKVMPINIMYYELRPNFNKLINQQLLVDADLLYQAITSIKQVENFCNKIGAQLILAGVLTNIEFLRHSYLFKNYVHLASGVFDIKEQDVGTDNRHPGPLTHRYYANKILETFWQQHL